MPLWMCVFNEQIINCIVNIPVKKHKKYIVFWINIRTFAHE